MAATPELCLEHTQLTWQLLTDLGFLGNLKKSVLAPKQQAEYLGFIVNSIKMTLFLTEEKLLRAKLEAERLLKSNPVVKILASFLGFCQSTLPAIAVAPLHFRNLQADMIKALKGSRGGQGYRSVVCLSPEAKKELEWWRDYVKMNNGKSILPRKNKTQYSQTLPSKDGGTSESCKNRGSMELGGKVKSTHKLARVKSSFPGFASFSSPTKTSACSDWHRQQNSNDLYQQIRGNPFTSSHISSLRDVKLCSRQKPDFVSSVCSRRGKPDCRQKVKGVPGQPGMDAASSGVSGITKRSWLFQYRSLCNTGEPSGSCICQLETRAWGSCHRCFQCKMGFSTGLPIPSLLYDQKVPQKNSARSGTLCPDHTSVEKQPLVSSHSISVSRATIASAKMAGSSETSRHRKDTPPVPSKKLQAGCMAHFRAKLTKEGFSQKVSDILLASWRKKTASQYESAWKAWSEWCSEQEINPFSTTLENIFEFLADLFHKGFKFRTLGVYRSAISSNHETVDGFVIGKHPMMAKFMKGVFSLRPPEPKYFVTWDVRQVLDFLKTWSPVESLSLKQLTLKLVMLAALITAARSSSVNKMNLCFKYFKPHGVLFKVPGLTKCAGPKRPLQNLFLASFPPDRRLCFVNYLKQYEKVTKNL